MTHEKKPGLGWHGSLDSCKSPLQPTTLTRASSSVYLCITGRGSDVLLNLKPEANSAKPRTSGTRLRSVKWNTRT